MDHRIKAGGYPDKWNALPAEATQQQEALHRPKAINPKFRGAMTSEVGQLFEEKKLGAEEMQITEERKDWAGDWQLLPSQQGSSYSWNSFLPQRQLKILLVETDDSTRQILSALLRNCNYEVHLWANRVMEGVVGACNGPP